MCLDQYGRTHDDRKRAEQPLPPSRYSLLPTAELIDLYRSTYERGKRLWYHLGMAGDGWHMLEHTCPQIAHELSKRGISAQYGIVEHLS